MESKGEPGIFSQVLSELAAPFLDEDEADLFSEDSSSVDPSSEDTSKEEGNDKNIHQDYPSSSENKEEEDNEDIVSKRPSSEESSDKGNKDANDNNIPSVDSISEKNLRKEDKNKEDVSPHTSSENKLDNYDHPSSLEENVDKSDSSSREITSDVAIRDEDDKKINEEPQFASSKYMSVSRDSCAFIQSCFPLAGEQKKRKIFFSHTSGSLGVSVCVGGEGRGGEGTSHMVGCIEPVFLACCCFSLPDVSHPPFKLCSFFHFCEPLLYIVQIFIWHYFHHWPL